MSACSLCSRELARACVFLLFTSPPFLARARSRSLSPALVSVRAPRLRFLSLSPLRALHLFQRFEVTRADQAASMIIVTAAHAKDKDENPKIKAANNPTNNIPKTQCIKTAPLLEVDGSRLLLSRARACVCVFLFTSPPFLARTLCNGFRSKPQTRSSYQNERTGATALGLHPKHTPADWCNGFKP